ncbi:MAG TPA: hypothetical protein VFI37_04865 [Gaiellaceae bacterium]|nr:hypothetical protein [Gaiellaceae bacterium]
MKALLDEENGMRSVLLHRFPQLEPAIVHRAAWWAISLRHA